MKEIPKEATGSFNRSNDEQATTILGNSEAEEAFDKIIVLENSQNSQENTCVGVSFLVKERHRQRCFPANFEKCLRTHFLKRNSGRLLLEKK